MAHDSRNPIAISSYDFDAQLSKITAFINSYYTSPPTPIRPHTTALTTVSTTLLSRLPSSPRPLDETVKELLETIVPALPTFSNPNFYGFVTGGTTPAAYLADLVVSTVDQNNMVHLPFDSIATHVEHASVQMLCQMFGLEGFEGTLTTGATSANILGLAVAREYLLTPSKCSEVGYLRAAVESGWIGGVKVITATPHSSIGKAASILGLGQEACINLPKSAQEPWSFDLEALEKLLRKAEHERVRYIVVPGFGEVNTGRFTERVVEIRNLCDEYGAWLHIDAAFGLFARLFRSDKGGDFAEIGRWSEGLELADSICGDGHKLLNVPYDCGLFFTRHLDLLQAVCGNAGAAYLATNTSTLPSPCNTNIENSRRFRALPVYASLTTYGRSGYRTLTENLIRHARALAKVIDGMKEDYELLTEVEDVYNCILFKARDDELNERLEGAINATGNMWVSGTVWGGRRCVRIAVGSWRVSEKDVAVVEQVLRVCLP